MSIALVFGLSVRFIHQKSERFVDRVFFRKRHEDEVALRRFAHEAAFITDIDVLLDRTVDVVKEHASAEQVAVMLLAPGSEYENDPAIVALRAWHVTIELLDYGKRLEGDRAFPMIDRTNLSGRSCAARRAAKTTTTKRVRGGGGNSARGRLALDALAAFRGNSQGQLIALHHELLMELRALQSTIHDVGRGGGGDDIAVKSISTPTLALLASSLLVRFLHDVAPWRMNFVHHYKDGTSEASTCESRYPGGFQMKPLLKSRRGPNELLSEHAVRLRFLSEIP